MDPPRTPPVGRLAFGLAAGAFLLGAGPSVGVRDAGELATAAFRVDVAHPTGFVADLVLFRASQLLLPVGDAAFRANVAVAVLMALAVALAARLAYALGHGLPAPARVSLALPTAAAMMTSPTIVRAGTAVEVYASALVVSLAALTMAVAAPDRSARGRHERVLGFLAGATLLLHTSARAAVLLGLAAVVIARASTQRALARVAALGAGLAAGASPVLYLLVAARRAGPIDWGDPRTPQRMLAHLSAARIRAAFAHRILVPWRIPEDLARVADVLRADLRPWLLLVGTAGALVAARSRRARWLALAAVIDLAYATLVNPMGVRDRQTLFVSQAALAILASFALAVAARTAMRARPASSRPLVALVTVLAVSFGALAAASAPRGASARADGWSASEILGGAGALGEVPPRAIVLCESDDLCGVGLYAQFVEGERPDVVILPRQHLADPSTWRRARSIGALAVQPSDDLRVARLRALCGVHRTQIRWEAGEVDDERRIGSVAGTGETPVLGVLDAPAGPLDREAAAWLAPRLGDGTGARVLAATVLFGAGRRLAAHAGLDEAAPLWRRALDFDPEHAPAYTNLGVAMARRGAYGQAIALTERALEIDPDRAVAWRNLSAFRAAVGDASGAQRAREAYARRFER